MKNNYFFRLLTLKKIFFIVFTLSMSASMFALDITSGLIVRYTFDGASGTTITDDSGNGNIGTLFGTPMTVAGYSGNAMSFPAATDYMTLPEGVVGTLKSFTIATWVNLTATNTWARIFDFGSGTSYYMFLSPKASSGKVRFAFKNGGGEELIDGTAALATGKWVHVAVVYNYNESTSKGAATIFVDGNPVGTNSNMTIYPALLSHTTQNYIAKSQWPDPTLAGSVDDFRLYNRALTSVDVMALAGMPGDLVSAFSALTESTILNGNSALNNVLSNLNLPASLSSYPSVSITWTSTAASNIAIDGTVTRPATYDATSKLTATLTQVVNEVSYTLTKDFIATVKSTAGMPAEIAQWDFSTASIGLNGGIITATDSKSGFIGTLKNDARIRTIGNSGSDQFNVLDLGNGTGYFDMGTNIGEAIYGLSDYTVCGYYYIDPTYTQLNNNGNFYWTFSNSANSPVDQNGYIIGSLKNQSNNCTTNYWATGDQSVGVWSNAPTGGWHHLAYVQNATTGTIFVDGAQVATGGVTNLPSIALRRPELNGTPFNWLGRSNYPTDSYLRQTLLYDFRLYSVPLSSSDISLDVVQVLETLDKLNNAFAQNPDYVDNSLIVEKDNLSLGDLSMVTSNLTLPSKGTIDPSILITWKSSNTNLISNDGIVTRPNYYNYTDTLTATLIKNGQSVMKKFYAVVALKEGTAFQNDLLVKYDFSQVTDSTVTDVAEKHFQGTVKMGASIATIGTSTPYKVLNLGDSIGYFDLGTEMGKIMYNLGDYTVSAYFRINAEYPDTELAKNGNFIWNFSNSKDILSTPTGYLIASLKNQANTITPTRWDSEQTVLFGAPAIKDGWHNMAYTQSGNIGTIYIDGMPMATGDVTSLLKDKLAKEGLLGTLYNWIGRSCYTGDVYLRKTLVYDFRLYRVALSDTQIQTTELKVGNTINALDMAFTEGLTSVKSIRESEYKVTSKQGEIIISGLNGNENVTVYNASGNQIKVADKTSIKVKTGVYIIRINNFATKVIVK